MPSEGSPYWSSSYDPEYVWVVRNEVEDSVDVEIFGTEDLAIQYAQGIYGSTSVSRYKVQNEVPEWIIEQQRIRKREERIHG